VQKAEQPTVINTDQNGEIYLTPKLDMLGLKESVINSSILPQCIKAYKNNIAGFGIGVKYKDDLKETTEMTTEYTKATEILETLTLEQDLKEVFENIIEARETYGTAYLEVIRNLLGEVVQIEFVKETPSILKAPPIEPYIDATYYQNGTEIMRKKKFCKYKQEINGSTVYLKEFGDPRIMDYRTGQYIDDTPREYQANEIIEFALGIVPYGEVRWQGQIRGVDGSRRAEDLNRNYFLNGRHTPLMIIVKGGTLTEDSFAKLQEYMLAIKGESGQHAFMVLEASNLDSRAEYEDGKVPEVEIKELASILQKDELFQDYLDNNRKRIQSAFQLPDLYTGYTTDFNRATAQTAQEITEKQVFQPERKSLAWAINHKLLAGYKFKFVEVYFKQPEITNPDDLSKILNIAERAGGLTPNKAKEIIYETLGDNFEPFVGEWADIPLTISKTQEQLTQQIAKAESNGESEIVAVMKEVKKFLEKGERDGL
jgi:PBSX family phage portal protein